MIWRQGVGRVLDRAAVAAGVDVDGRPDDVDLGVHQAAQADRDRRQVALEEARVADRPRRRRRGGPGWPRATRSRWTELDSSSPSKTNLRLTGSAPRVASRAAAAITWAWTLALVVGRAAGQQPVADDGRLERRRRPTGRAGRPAGRRSGRRRGPSGRRRRGASRRRRSGGRRSRRPRRAPGRRRSGRRPATRPRAGSRPRARGARRCSGCAGSRASERGVARRIARGSLEGGDGRRRSSGSSVGRSTGVPDGGLARSGAARRPGRLQAGLGRRLAGTGERRDTPWSVSFGGRSLKSASKSSASTVSSATSFSASVVSLSRWTVRTSVARS